MANILPRHYITGIIIFTLLIVSGVAMMTSFQGENSEFMSDTDEDTFEKFNQTFNVMEDLTTEVDALKTNIEGEEEDAGFFKEAFGFLNSLISKSWNTLKLLFTSLSFMNAVFGGLSVVLGFPYFLPILLGMLVTVLIAFAIYSAIFQRDI